MHVGRSYLGNFFLAFLTPEDFYFIWYLWHDEAIRNKVIPALSLLEP